MAEFTVKYKTIEGHDLELAHDGDAGYDLRATRDITVPFNSTTVVETAVELRLPDGLYAEITSRSGLADKHDVAVLNAPGIIDTGYEGPIKVILRNFGNRDFMIKENDRVAQLVFHRVVDVAVEKVSEFESPNKPEEEQKGEAQTKRRTRGRGGLGSTGN